jgi:hypothetical protein
LSKRETSERIWKVCGMSWMLNSGFSTRRFLIPQWRLQVSRSLRSDEATGEKLELEGYASGFSAREEQECDDEDN